MLASELKFENYESVQHRLQFSGIKKGAKISFHRHFNENVCRVHTKRQVIIKMYKFNMFITAVCVLFLIKLGDGPRTKVFKNVVFPAQAECSYFSADFRLRTFLHHS